ncbi:hypothetical protein [Mycobacteroides abscessus]|uniref:hypothetical protein n=1 Tax=Mycobacteroides abscessus TaxID=36809 RepID=UPI001049BC6C|nr:hypothetical protein [Mycobacteroides abscessus]
MTYSDGVCTSITGAAIDLSRVAAWDARARALVTHIPDEDGGWVLAPPTAAPPRREEQRTQYTASFLQEVADAFARNGYQGVQDHFTVRRRQASRYIAKARDAGLIER